MKQNLSGKLRHEAKDTTSAGFATVEESEIGTKTVQRGISLISIL